MNTKTINLLKLLPLALLLVISSCNDDEDDDPKPDKDNSSSNDFQTNAKAELNVNSNINAMISEMKKGDGTNNNTIDKTKLKDNFEKGSPSAKSISTEYYRDSINVWINEIVKASKSDSSYNIGKPASQNGEGGTLGDHLFDEHGREFEQLIDKGLYGAAQFNHAINTILKDDITVKDLHRIMALYGTDPDDQESERTFAAHYADDHPGANQTFHDEIKTEFTAAIKKAKNNGSISENSQRISKIKKTWEKAIVARGIHYMNVGINNFTKLDKKTELQKADILHEFAEGVGLIHGLYKVKGKIIDDSKIKSVMEKMNLPIDGPITLYKFFQSNNSGEVKDLEQARNELDAVYGFSNSSSF